MRTSTVVTALAATLAAAATIVVPAAAQTDCTVRLCEAAGLEAVCDPDGTTCATFLMTVALGDDDDDDADEDAATDGATVVLGNGGTNGVLNASDPDPAGDADAAGDAEPAVDADGDTGSDAPAVVVAEDADEPDESTDSEDAEVPEVSDGAVVLEAVDVADGTGVNATAGDAAVDTPDADDAVDADADDAEPADADGAEVVTADADAAVAAIPDLSPCAVGGAVPTAPCVAGSLCVVTSLTSIDGTGSGTCFALPTPRVGCETACASSMAVDGIVCALPGSRAAICGTFRAVAMVMTPTPEVDDMAMTPTPEVDDMAMTPTPEDDDMEEGEGAVEVMNEVTTDGTEVVTEVPDESEATCVPACTDSRVCLRSAAADFRCVRLSGVPGACSDATCPATTPGAVCTQGAQVIACALFEGDM